MTFEREFIEAKLGELKRYREEIQGLLASSDEDILRDSYKYHTAERLLQLAVDTILDINQHFIKELGLEVEDDFQSTFYILGAQRIFSEEFAKKIAPIVGLRNRIVHRYETIDRELFITSLRKNFDDMKTYSNHIQKYLETEK